MKHYPWWHPWNWIDPYDLDSWLMTIFGLLMAALAVALIWKAVR